MGYEQSLLDQPKKKLIKLKQNKNKSLNLILISRERGCLLYAFCSVAMFLINHIIFKAHKKVGVASSKFSFLYVNLRKMSVLRKKLWGRGVTRPLPLFVTTWLVPLYSLIKRTLL